MNLNGILRLLLKRKIVMFRELKFSKIESGFLENLANLIRFTTSVLH